jgi:hypothetical protein
MKNSRARKILIAAIVVIVSAAVLAVINSFGFSPDPNNASTFIVRAQQKFAPGIQVAASALGASESRQFFREDLARLSVR